MCSHRYMVFSNSQPASLMNITPGDKLSFFTPFTYTAAVGYLLKTIFKGARACLYDARTRGLAGMAEWLEAEGVTVLVAPPSSFRAIFNSLPENKLLEQLRFVHTGGEKTALADVTLFRAHTTPSCVLLFTLSSTETTAITLLSVDHSMPVTETTVITGYPLPGHEIFLLDENRQPVKPGETGEIAVRTRYLASGYWKQPELTAKKFVQDPHDPRIHTFFTGDLGRWLPDGALQFQGRKDDMVKIRGHRVEIREVNPLFPGIRLYCNRLSPRPQILLKTARNGWSCIMFNDPKRVLTRSNCANSFPASCQLLWSHPVSSP